MSDKLSAAAKKLLELAPLEHGLHRDPGLTAIIKAHPELIEGLDEYIRHRDKEVLQIAGASQARSTGHGVKTALARLASK